MRWRMDAALRQSDAAMWAMLKLGLARTIYPVWFENAARVRATRRSRQWRLG